MPGTSGPLGIIGGSTPRLPALAVRYKDSRCCRAARDAAMSRRILGANSRNKGPDPPCASTL